MYGRKITPRVKVIEDLNDHIGDIFPISISPTGRGKLLYCEGDKAHYEVTESEIFTKYNFCAGQKFYLPMQMAQTIKAVKDA